MSKRKFDDGVFEYHGQIVPKDVVSVRFHPSVVEVEDMAFKDCKQLKKVILNDGLRDIGNSAFKGCSQLREVVFNNGIKKICLQAFQKCTSLQSINLPSTLTFTALPSTLPSISLIHFTGCGCRSWR